ncbi:MAG: PAS domain S-box protein [Candidatus Aminicenantes bacterium]|jgi:PAS domain S-box-containing protein/putative nucleotidyltransferase with HDIG domain
MNSTEKNGAASTVPDTAKSRSRKTQKDQKAAKAAFSPKIPPEAGNGYLDQLFENAQEAIVMTDNRGRVLRVNGEFEKLFGYTRAEMTGKLVDPMIVPKGHYSEASSLTKRATKGEQVVMDTERRRKDGSLIDVSVLASPIRVNGKISAAFAIYRNITDRKKAERALHHRIEFNKLVSSISSRYVMTHDFDEATDFALREIGKFIEADRVVVFLLKENELVLDITHEWCKKGVPSRKADQRVTPIDKLPWWMKQIRRKKYVLIRDVTKLPAEAENEREILNRYKIKSLFAIPLVSMGEFAGFIAFHNVMRTGVWDNGDMALLKVFAELVGNALERKRGEDFLRESEEKYRSVVEKASDGIAILQDSKIKFVNPRLAKMWGGDVEEMLDRPLTDFLHPDEIPKVLERYKKRLAGKKVLPIYETIMKRKNGSYLNVELNIGLSNFCGQRATQVFARDITERKQAQTWRKVLEGSIEAIALTLEMRDPYTAGHQQRVSRLACAIAEEMNLTEKQIDGLRIAGLIHDLGKVTIPAEILSKPSKLTETEFSIIKNHPQVAYDILKKINFPWPVADIVLQHHEYLDGSGYPQCLEAKDILLETRILTVADVVEAMASHRPYRPALGIEKALDEIKFGSGIRFDADVVNACLAIFSKAFTLD